MRLVHHPVDGDDRPLATIVEVADSPWSLLRGLRGRTELPEDYALVLDVAGATPFGSGPRRTTLDMLFVGVTIDAVWLIDGQVVATKRLAPWIGVGSARADTVIELPAGAARDVAVGDTITRADDPSGTAA